MSCLRPGLPLGLELMIIQHNNTSYSWVSFSMLYVNDYNCNKSCLGTCFSATIYLAQRHIAQKSFLLLRSYPRMNALRKGLVELLHTWGILFILISQLKSPAEASEEGTLSIPFWCLCQKLLLSFHFKKFCCTKLWETDCVFSACALLQSTQTLHQPP